MLAQHGIEFTERDIFKVPLTFDELAALAAFAAVSDLFSWKSPTARQRGITPGSRSDDELLRRMAEEPRLIRRPLLRHGERLVIGADATAIGALAS